MRRELIDLLGAGYARLSARQRKILFTMLGISLAVHVVGLLVFGGWIIMRQHTEERVVFVAPPPVKTYQPRELEHRVKVQKKQRSSSRPSMMPRMVAMKTSDLALPEIKLDAKVIKTSFQPKFKAVAGTGLGVGLGTGYGVGGFGTGVSEFDFFGIRGRGDRIAILVDVSVSMVEPERGGPAGFIRVRNRINEVIDELHDAAMFNVVVFADAASTWQDKVVIASAENKQKAKEWLMPFNSEGNYGLASGSYGGIATSVPAVGGTTRLDLALTAAFEHGADTVLLISDGLPRVEKGLGGTARSAYDKQMAEWRREHADEIAAANAAEANAQYVEEKVWIPDQPATPLREGQPARPAVKGHWETRRVRVGGPVHRPAPPPQPEKQYWTFEDFVRHLSELQAKFYQPKGRKPPVIHCIGYQIDDAGGKFMRNLTGRYEGRYRRVAHIK